MNTIKRLKLDQGQQAPPSVSSEQKPSILSQLFVCLELVFDYIELKDLCSVGLTCKRLHQMAGEYFQSYYTLEMVRIGMNDEGCVAEASHGIKTNFGCYAQQLYVIGNADKDVDEKSVHYVSKIKNKNLKSIWFGRLRNFTVQQGESLKEILKNVECVEFLLTPGMEFSFDNIFRFCSNLKYMSMLYPNGLPMKHYPTVEHLTVWNREVDEIKAFLRMNPQIKKISTDVRAGQLMDMIAAADMQFDGLGIQWHNQNVDVVCLNDLHERGYFKRLNVLMLNSDSRPIDKIIDELKDINGLVALRIDSFNIIGMKNDVTLPKLKMLLICGDINLEKAKILIKCFPNLVEFHLYCASAYTVAALVCNMPSLEYIEVRHLIGSNAKFNAKALNEDREKLPFAKPLTINLRPEAFLKVRWATVDFESRLVNIRRSTKSVMYFYDFFF